MLADDVTTGYHLPYFKCWHHLPDKKYLAMVVSIIKQIFCSYNIERLLITSVLTVILKLTNTLCCDAPCG